MSLSESIRWQPPKPDPILLDFERRCRVAKEQPFLDEKSIDDTTTDCAWANLRRPRLGRFKQQGAFTFTNLLGYGQDGIVWKVDAGGGQIYALKVFWDNHPPEGTRYWAVQRECQKRLTPRNDAMCNRTFFRPHLVEPKAENIARCGSQSPCLFQ
ncbi:hypothetical protein CEP52_016718 [Fusarium oligoseptatum]|uniref:Protein kinase domain-containing protein n=1 Tax=Fusarium oligoseptatum TaxID=2604345 RepID=A0A428S150_9HYPO|nr:hypothetical protein CEP52_016718 [Fusarium oligoseptatum]